MKREQIEQIVEHLRNDGHGYICRDHLGEIVSTVLRLGDRGSPSSSAKKGREEDLPVPEQSDFTIAGRSAMV
ncbi:MAG: hypothetical protein NTZ87_04220 [Candidatus Nomurabacteria bacterium]|nr:hypothetical protein [Candidatus Nomurabacteria bacterium]